MQELKMENKLIIKKGMHYQTQIISQACDILGCKNLSELAKKTGTPISTLYRQFYGERNMTLNSILKIIKSCNITSIELKEG